MNLLTPHELWELTHRKKKTAQRAALNQMGIQHIVRPDGSIAVLQEHVRKVMGGMEDKQKRRNEPNWSAIRA